MAATRYFAKYDADKTLIALGTIDTPGEMAADVVQITADEYSALLSSLPEPEEPENPEAPAETDEVEEALAILRGESE